MLYIFKIFSRRSISLNFTDYKYKVLIKIIVEQVGWVLDRFNASVVHMAKRQCSHLEK